MIVHKLEIAIGSGTLTLETGKLAKQAHGAVVVSYGETMILATAVEGVEDPRRDFFPLVVDYREKFYAAGRFPGGYIKRENRPSLKETLTARLIDRPIRPLFPANYLREVQIMVSTLAADRQNDPDILGMIGASAALHISHLPFLHPTAAIRIGRVNGQLIPMPTQEQLEQSDLDLVIAGTKSEVTMIEGFAREIPEDQMLQAIVYGQSLITRIVEAIEKFREVAGLPAKQYPAEPAVNPLIEEFKKKFYGDFTSAKVNANKAERYAAIKALKEKIKAEYLAEGQTPVYTPAQVEGAFAYMEERVVRDQILGGRRIDGRAMDEIRAIHCEAGVLPRVHGSALFQRGETQALVVVTLGTSSDEQSVEGLGGEISKKFMLDYNFPPFSVGECKPIRAPGRRELGHGALAERSLKPIIPGVDEFPYTIRVVSDILESNGSSSQASVCGGTLALMDAGVPITNPVAGISIGLVKEPDRHILLTDIQGDEDHFCDMDFKVAGTGVGITGIQLDLKINGISEAIIKDALEQARLGRRHILKQMLGVLRQPREEISTHAPRLLTVQIDPQKIGMLIGPGGKNIKGIQESTGAKIDIEDDGTVYISHIEAAGAEAARRRVEAITEEIKVGKTYEGKVTSIKEFGAFVEIAPGRDGLCHISELDDRYIERVDEVCKIGDILQVRVIAIDEHDRVKLSRKVILRELAGKPPEAPREERSGGGDRGGDRGGRGGRGGDRGGRGGDRGGDRGPREPRGDDRGPREPRGDDRAPREPRGEDRGGERPPAPREEPQG